MLFSCNLDTTYVVTYVITDVTTYRILFYLPPVRTKVRIYTTKVRISYVLDRTYNTCTYIVFSSIQPPTLYVPVLYVRPSTYTIYVYVILKGLYPLYTYR